MKPRISGGTSWDRALGRAMLGGAIAGATAAVAVLGADNLIIIKAGLGAFLGVLGARFVAEGWMDKPAEKGE